MSESGNVYASLNDVCLKVRTDCALISTTQVTKRLIDISVAVETRAEAHTVRPALNMALVIDRSGSMTGPKLEYVKQAALHLIDCLDETDQVTVVTFDDHVDTLASPTRLTRRHREETKRRVAALHTGGSTALFDGWLTGAELVASHPVPGAVARVCLLTDGLANVGESRVEVLEHHAQQLASRGVSTSTFGVGSDFNQFLLEGMAARGGGTYRFIETPDQIPDMFAEELGLLVATSARQVELRVTVPEGASLTLLGGLPHTGDESQLLIPVGEMYARIPRTFFVEALLPPGGIPGRELRMRVVAAGTGADDRRFIVESAAVFTRASTEQVIAAPSDREMCEAATAVRLRSAESEALRADFAGEGERGARILEEAILSSVADAAPELLEELEVLSRSMRRQKLDKMESKTRHSAAYRTRRRE